MSRELNLHYTLRFDRSRKDAFLFMKDVKRRKEFMTIVDQTKIVHATKSENLKGLRFIEVTHFLGFDMKLGYEIVDFKNGFTIVTACKDGPFYPCIGVTLSDGDLHSCIGEVDIKLDTSALKLVPTFLLKPTIEAVIKPILKRLVDCVNNN